jgi:hypothetical protein
MTCRQPASHSRRREQRRSHAAILSLLVLAACGAGGGERSSAVTDTVPPQIGTVNDGVDGDVDTQTSTTRIDAHWLGFSDDSGAIAEYQWAIGTTLGGSEVQNWTSVGTATAASNAALVLEPGRTYYTAVRAFDAAGNGSAVASSDGVRIDGGNGGSGGSGGGTLASSITQFGITWQFAAAASVGQFANGDWWVLGPVDIVSIAPPTQNVNGRQIHGSMVNPTTVQNGEHGYDSMLFHPHENGRYQPALNVALGVSAATPLLLPGGQSLISTISYLGSSPAGNGSFSQLTTAAVLTVLASAPPSDAFRPPYAGTDKTIRHREQDLDYTRLASIALTPGAPSLASIEAGVERVWLDHASGWTSRYMHPIENMPDYGRDFTSLFGAGCLLLNGAFTTAQKRTLAVRMSQIGIDHFGNVTAGISWDGVGGQNSGRKFAILLAGTLLNHAPMLAIGTSHPSGYFGPGNPANRSSFGEDCQTFYVQQTSPGVVNWGFGGYGTNHVGLAEWGNKHTTFPSNDNVQWNADSYRRCCTGNAWVGQTLAARIMGLRDEWNHPAYFDYMDRFMQTETVGSWTRSWDPWQQTMWDQYRSSF